MFQFICDRPKSPGSDEACGFSSTGWATQEQADLRGKEHYKEHDDGEEMTELHEFQSKVGFN